MFSVISELKKKTCKYVGLNIIPTQIFDIMLDQTTFMDHIKPVETSRDRTKIISDKLRDGDIPLHKTVIGQILWATNQTCLDITFHESELSSAVKHATIRHLSRANKVLKTKIREFF